MRWKDAMKILQTGKLILVEVLDDSTEFCLQILKATQLIISNKVFSWCSYIGDTNTSDKILLPENTSNKILVIQHVIYRWKP